MTENVVASVLRLLLDENLFPSEGEFETITGFTIDEYRDLRQSLEARGSNAALDEHQYVMMLAAVNNVVGYPHGRVDLLEEEFTCTLQNQKDYMLLQNSLERSLIKSFDHGDASSRQWQSAREI